MADSTSMSAFDRCRAVYDAWDRSCRTRGVDSGSVEQSRRLAGAVDGRRFVMPIAYQPTGVALGCPLPDDALTQAMRSLAERFAGLLREQVPGVDGGFAFVPSKAYHITVVNFTHYNVNEPEEVAPMAPELFQTVAENVRAVAPKPIDIEIDGVVLTAQGKLMVRGLPHENTLFTLRELLCEQFPDQLAIQLPPAAHIKLGHLLVPLDAAGVAAVLGRLQREGGTLTARVIFRELHTPRGRVPLQG